MNEALSESEKQGLRLGKPSVPREEFQRVFGVGPSSSISVTVPVRSLLSKAADGESRQLSLERSAEVLR